MEMAACLSTVAAKKLTDDGKARSQRVRNWESSASLGRLPAHDAVANIPGPRNRDTSQGGGKERRG